jgi:hypothetical protein
MQRWDELPVLVADSVLNTFVTVGTYDDIAEKLLGRYGDVVTDIEFSIAVRNDEERLTLAKLAAQIQGASDAQARATIRGAEPDAPPTRKSQHDQAVDNGRSS